MLRVHLNWGGRLGVARRRPVEGTDPDDPAYDWRLYDRVVLEARAARGRGDVHDLRHAGLGERRRAADARAARRGAAARVRLRRGDALQRRRTSAPDGTLLPRVRYWTAWNEPNLQIGLVPQWRRVGGRWVIQSARDYARICNAVVDGVAHVDAARARRSPAASRRRAGTTTRAATSRPSRRSRSCAR